LRNRAVTDVSLSRAPPAHRHTARAAFGAFRDAELAAPLIQATGPRRVRHAERSVELPLRKLDVVGAVRV